MQDFRGMLYYPPGMKPRMQQPSAAPGSAHAQGSGHAEHEARGTAAAAHLAPDVTPDDQVSQCWVATSEPLVPRPD